MLVSKKCETKNEVGQLNSQHCGTLALVWYELQKCVHSGTNNIVSKYLIT